MRDSQGTDGVNPPPPQPGSHKPAPGMEERDDLSAQLNCDFGDKVGLLVPGT